MIDALKGALMFLGIISLMIFIVVAAEIAVMLFIQNIDEIRDKRRKGRG